MFGISWSTILLGIIGFAVFAFTVWKSYVPYFPTPHDTQTPEDSNAVKPQ
jgi:hypothetical protein